MDVESSDDSSVGLPPNLTASVVGGEVDSPGPSAGAGMVSGVAGSCPAVGAEVLSGERRRRQLKILRRGSQRLTVLRLVPLLMPPVLPWSELNRCRSARMGSLRGIFRPGGPAWPGPYLFVTTAL